MRYDQKQFTQQGLNLFTNALSQKQSITIDKVIMDNLPTSNLSNLALLTLDDFSNAQSFPANYTKVDNSMLTVDSVISNQGFTSSYSANEIGLVGHAEGNNDETLIAILVASDPFVLPAQQQDETPLHLIPNVTIQLANNDMGQVPVDTAQDVYIPQQDLDSLVAQHGYIKFSNADNRYVKQTDFQNEVNNSVNEKADKSDLNNLQSNINNDVQPQLNQKANQSDLNNTNGVVANKADQSDVNQKFNQAENDVQTKANQSDLNTTNSNVSNNTNTIPQVFNQVTAHSDQNYNNLNNKFTSIKAFWNYNDAINNAKSASEPILCVYPDNVQAGKAISMKCVYGLGNLPLPDIPVPVENANPSSLEFDNVSATFSQQNKRVYLKGRITFKTDPPFNDYPLAKIDFSNLGMNGVVKQENSTFGDVYVDNTGEKAVISNEGGGIAGGGVDLSNGIMPVILY